jgi:hypothetical protein
MKTTSATIGFAILFAVLCWAAPAKAADLKLLSQGLPQESYTGSGKPVNKDTGPEKPFDGVCDGTAWCTGPAYPAWLMVDLGADYNIIKTMTYMEKSHVWYSYKIEASADQKTWVPFADQTKNKEPSDDPAYTDMGGTVGRYVRITLTDASDRDKSWFWPVILEFQVSGIPVEKPPEKPAEKKE